MTTTAQQLFDEAFDRVRDPRSDAYKAGCLAFLRYRQGEMDRADFYCPFEIGTAESDAWFAGCEEGKLRHRMYRDAIQEQ